MMRPQDGQSGKCLLGSLVFCLCLALLGLYACGGPTPLPDGSGQEPPPQDKGRDAAPPTEQPPTEQTPTEQPPTEQPPTEQPPTEQPPTEQPPTEQPPTEQPPTENLPPEKTLPELPPAVQGKYLLATVIRAEEHLWRPCDTDGEKSFRLAASALDQIAKIYENHQARLTIAVGLGFAESSARWKNVTGGVQDLAQRGHQLVADIQFPLGPIGKQRGVHCKAQPEDKLCLDGDSTCTGKKLTQATFCMGIRRRIQAVSALLSSPVTGVVALLPPAPLNLFPCLKAAGIRYLAGLQTTPLAFQKDAACPQAKPQATLTAIHPFYPIAQAYPANLYQGAIFHEQRQGNLLLLPGGRLSGLFNPNEGLSLTRLQDQLKADIRRADSRKVSGGHLTATVSSFLHGGKVSATRLKEWERLLSALAPLVVSQDLGLATLGQLEGQHQRWQSSSKVFIYPQHGGFENKNEILSQCSLDKKGVAVAEVRLGWISLDGRGPGTLFDREDQRAAWKGKFALRLGEATSKGQIQIVPGDAKTLYAVACKPGETLVVHAYVQSENNASPGFGFRFYRDPPRLSDNTLSDNVRVYPVGRKGWRELSATTTVPKQTRYCALSLVRDGTGRVWFDDLWLERK